MKIKKSQLKSIIREGIKVILAENKKKPRLVEEKMTPEQKKFAMPIFQAAAKKGGFKIKEIYMSRQPQAVINVFKYGMDSGSLWSIWGSTLTKKAAMDIKKIVEKNDSAMVLGEKSYRPKIKVGNDTEFLSLYDAAVFAGIKYDHDEYDKLFRNN